jgi:hypothetical protein
LIGAIDGVRSTLGGGGGVQQHLDADLVSEPF